MKLIIGLTAITVIILLLSTDSINLHDLLTATKYCTLTQVIFPVNLVSVFPSLKKNSGYRVFQVLLNGDEK